MRPRGARRHSGLLFVLLLAGCAAPPSAPRPGLTPVSFADLPGWRDDDVAAALPALARSCAALAKLPDGTALGPATAGDWRGACAALPGARDARAYFETWFRPYAAAGPDQLLLTGYYEPAIEGSRTRTPRFSAPLLQRPPDLVPGKPYLARAQIESGALDRFGPALAWADPVEAFFLQVQGSGSVRLAGGGALRLGYAGDNGRPYVAIGKVLVARGALAPDRVSLQSIKAWLRSHPADAKGVMDENPRYVFFRVLPGGGPVGSAGVALTPGRSLAVDPDFVPLGAPVWLDVAQDGAPTRRLAVAQDAGGAIKGRTRADLFWGAGEEAERAAGGMRAFGRYYLLLPRSAAARPQG